ncbi:putative carboxypeptidase D [Helianthus anomalus]
MLIASLLLLALATVSQSGFEENGMWRVGHIGQSYDPCTEQHSIAYFNLPEVQNTLHAYHFNSSKTWVTCSGVVGMYWQDSPISVLDVDACQCYALIDVFYMLHFTHINVYQVLIISGLRIWMFSGDTDVVIPTASTRYSIDALNLTTISPWRAWYEDAQVAPSILKIYIYIYIYIYIHTGGTRGGSRGSVDPPVSGTF